MISRKSPVTFELPRQGPGFDDSTLEALFLCDELAERPAILDIGCGPGMQTLALANALMDGHMTAVDIHQEYLDELKVRAKAAKAAAHINMVAGDMNRLPFPPQSFDLIWSEGAAYIMGFEKALATWKRLLKPGGYLVVSELVWLQPDPPTEVAAFFGREYPAMTNVGNIVATLQASGYAVGHMKVHTFGKPYPHTFHIAFKANKTRAETPRSSKGSC